MLRYVLRRLLTIPIGLLVAHFAGFAYAHLVLPVQLANNRKDIKRGGSNV